MSIIIRKAGFDDLPGILDIHNEILLNTTAIWEEKPEELSQRKAWMNARFEKDFPVLVAEDSGIIAAFASYGTWREHCGYFKTVEHTVHVHFNYRRHGLGSKLVSELIDIAKDQGRHVVLGGMSGDNEGSIAFHKRLGFRECGRMKEVGFKFGRKLDLVFMQKIIGQN
jgi:phosphinothricin acetyltransferase